MKRATLPILICLLSLSFCKKEEPIPPVTTPFCHQTSAVVNYVSASASNQYQVDYTFNDDQKLTNEGTSLTYTWSANQMIQRSFSSGALLSKTTFVLDNTGRALSQTTTDGSGSYDYNETFEYDASGYLVKVVRAGNYARTTTKEWAQGNLVKEVSTPQFGDVRTTTNTYNTNLTCPESFTRLPIYGKKSKNLIASQENVYPFGVSTYTLQYELDALGNVVKETSNGVDLGQTSTLTIQYSYEGCQ